MFTAWPNSKLIIAFFLLIGTGSHTLCTCVRRSYFLRNWSRLYLIFNKKSQTFTGYSRKLGQHSKYMHLKSSQYGSQTFPLQTQINFKRSIFKTFLLIFQIFHLDLIYNVYIYMMYIISLHVKYQSINADLQITFMKNKNFK